MTAIPNSATPHRIRRERISAFDWAAATDEELSTQFWVLNGWHLPGPQGQQPLKTGMSLVSTYPESFRRYFGASTPELPETSYTSPGSRPCALSDVTDRLDDAEASLDALGGPEAGVEP